MKSKKMTSIISAVFFSLSIILFIFFLLPVFAGIVSIGNVTGAFISGSLAAALLFREKFGCFVSQICERSTGRLFVSLVAVVAIVCAAVAIVISFFMVRAMNDKPEGETTIVVLGCQVKESGASLMLRKRLDTAIGYLSEHGEAKVIVSGGKGDDEPTSEAECMFNYLTSKGIPEERIFVEDRSVNTEENIIFSKEIIEREKLCPEITIVTDGYHQLRAEMFAKRQGLTSYNVSAPTSFWLVPTYWVRELIAVAYYYVKNIGG